MDYIDDKEDGFKYVFIYYVEVFCQAYRKTKKGVFDKIKRLLIFKP